MKLQDTVNSLALIQGINIFNHLFIVEQKQGYFLSLSDGMLSRSRSRGDVTSVELKVVLEACASDFRLKLVLQDFCQANSQLKAPKRTYYDPLMIEV